MKRLLLLLVFLFALAVPIAAQDSVSTANVNTLIFRGRSSAPSLSTSTQAVIYFDTATGRLRISEAGGAYANVVGAGVPAGADTQVQFNDAGAYGGDAGLTYNKTTNFLTVTNGGITLSTSTINKITITAPATGATLTLADGKTVTVNNTLTFVGTDGTTHTFPNASSTVAEVGFANVFTTSQAFQPATDVISLVVRRNGAAQTANVVEIQTELNALLVGIDKTGAFAFPDNVRQTFNPGADASGLNVGAIAGDPGTPSNGDVWYDSTANELTARINGSNVSLGAGGTPGGANTQIQYNNAGAFGGITGATSDGTSVTLTSPTINGGTNAKIFSSTGYSLTGADATNGIDLAGTWNTSGTPTAVKLNMTDTASNAASLLFDLQVGSTSQFKVSKAGVVTTTGVLLGPAGAASGPAFAFSSSTNTGMYIASGAPALSASGTSVLWARTTAVDIEPNTNQFTIGTDVGLGRTAAGILKATNGASLGGAIDIPGNAIANGQNLRINALTENTTLSVGGATTDTVIQLPANSIILSVTARITTTIADVDSTAVQIGDATVATRFGSMAALTAGTTTVGLNHMQGSVAADNAGPVQTSAVSVRITLAGGADNTPSAGAVRITIHYIQLTAATS